MIRVICSVICLAAVFAGNSKPPNNPNFGRDWSRYLAKRASNNDTDFQWFANKMSSLARVVTGVSLEVGILDSSIPIDEAVAEMLNIGDVRLGDLVAFDKNTLSSYLTKMETLQTKLNDSTRLIAEEIVAMSPIKELWKKTGDVTAHLNKDNFEALKVIIDLNNPNPLFRAKLANATTLLNAQKDDLKTLLKPLSELIDGILVIKGKVQPDGIIDYLKTLKPLEYFSLLLEYLESYKDDYTVQRLDPAYKTAMEADFLQMKAIPRVRDNWKIIADIVSNPITRYPKKHTSGLINGIDDLDSISNDLKDPVLAGKVPELKNLLSLKDKIKLLRDAWQPIANLETFRNMEFISHLRDDLITVKAAPGDITATIDSFAQCTKVVIDNDKKNAKLSLQSFLSSSKYLVFKLRSLKQLYAVVTNDQKAMLSKVITDGTGVQKVIDLMKEMEPLVQSVAGFNFLAESVYNTQVQDLLDDTRDQRTFFECISTNVQKEDKTFLVASIAKDLRQMTQETIDSINTAAQVISDSIPTIKEIRNITKNIQKDNSDKLMKLKGFQTKTKEFGDAVTVVAMVQKALVLNQELTRASDTTSNMQIFTSYTKDLKLKEIVQEEYFMRIDHDDVTKLLSQVEKLKTKIKKPAAGKETFSKYAPLFTEFSGLQSVNLRTKETLVALDPMLIELNNVGMGTTILVHKKAPLLKVAHLDLDFASHSTALNDVSNTLLELDYASGNTNRPPSTPAPGSPGSPGSPGGPGAPGAGGASAAALGGSSGGSDNTMIIVGVVVGVLLILGVIIGVVVYLKKKKSSAKKKGSTATSKPPGKDSAETNDPKSPGDDNGASPASPNPDGKEGGSKDVGASKEGGSKEVGGSKEKGSNEKIKGSNELV